VEALFAELKNQIGQFYMAAAVQNLKRLVRFLSFNPQPVTANI
jgi:hypothetical protein